MVLRANGIKTVLVTGTATSACVESTARDALFSDYYVVAVEDCCADLAQERHEWSMKIIQWGYGLVASAEDVQRIWSRQAPHCVRGVESIRFPDSRQGPA